MGSAWQERLCLYVVRVRVPRCVVLYRGELLCQLYLLLFLLYTWVVSEAVRASSGGACFSRVVGPLFVPGAGCLGVSFLSGDYRDLRRSFRVRRGKRFSAMFRVWFFAFFDKWFSNVPPFFRLPRTNRPNEHRRTFSAFVIYRTFNFVR